MFRSSARDETVQRLVTKHSTSIIRLAFAYVKNRPDAEDIAQEVFLAYLRKGPDFRDEAAERAWLLRVAANKSKDFLKSYWQKNTDPLSEDLSFLPSADGLVLKEVLGLEEKYRLPVWLHYFYGYTIKEIATCLRAKPAAVGTWLDRGRKLLRDRLGDGLDG